MHARTFRAWALVPLLLVSRALMGASGDESVIFPEPQQIALTSPNFMLNDKVTIIVSPQSSPATLQLARILTSDLSDRYGLGIRTVKAPSVPPEATAIVMGPISDPLVRTESSRMGLSVTPSRPGPEGYGLRVTQHEIVVAGSDDEGAFYGTQSLRQLIVRNGPKCYIRGVDVLDWPYKRFRGIHLFLPGSANIPFFKRFVADFMALYKFNKLILELDAGMRFNSHPELAAGWYDFTRDMLYTRRDRSAGPHQENQDSGNADNADGGVLEKEEVADLVRFANESHIEVIPEVASLTHSYYLLTRHRELAAVPHAEWPDTYSPDSDSHHLLFDVLNEVIAATHPKLILIGHDEWRIPLNECPLCSRKDPTELYIQDVNSIYDYLKDRNIRTALWGDHLVEAVRGKGIRTVVSKSGFKYTMPGALSPDQVRRSIPKDILVGNWFWKENGVSNEHLLRVLGFQQFYGNFTPEFQTYKERSLSPDIAGGAPSGWAATTELNVGKDLLRDFLGTANMLWSTHYPMDGQLTEIVQHRMPSIRRNLSGQILPSQTGDPVVEIKFSPGSGTVQINDDVSSVIFLHAAARPAFNEKAWLGVYNPADTAALLAWYEVMYDDGFVDTIPIRYGLNILASEWNQDKSSGEYCYECSPVRSKSGTWFSYEWTNPRLGKLIRQVRLHQISSVSDLRGRKWPADSVTLRAVSVVRKRDPKAETRASGCRNSHCDRKRIDLSKKDEIDMRHETSSNSGGS